MKVIQCDICKEIVKEDERIVLSVDEHPYCCARTIGTTSVNYDICLNHSTIDLSQITKRER